MGHQKVREVLLWASALLCVPIVTSMVLLQDQPVSLPLGVLFTVFSTIILVSAVFLLDMARRNPADSHTWNTLLHDYARLLTAALRGRNKYRQMMRLLADCRNQQEMALRRIIDLNQNTIYGKEHGISRITCREDLVSMYPLTDYYEYRSYAERIMEGEENVMTSEKVHFLSTSSGTTGKNKVFPLTEDHYTTAVSSLEANLYIHWDAYFKAGLARLFYPAKKAPCGLKMGGVGSHVFTGYPSSFIPACNRLLEKESSVFYSQAVLALSEAEVGTIDGFSSDVLLAWFDFLVANKEQLCSDIETGVLTPCDDFEGEILAEHQAHFRSDPARAEAVRDALSGPLEGLARRVWPRLHGVEASKSGSFAHAAKILADTYLKGVHMNFYMYGASEGWIGQQLEDDDSSTQYTLVPHDNFMEFIDIRHVGQESPKTVFMEQLEVGEMYEIVLTNRIGMYRYRLGDVIKITGYNKTCPKFIFVHRLGQILNIVFERTPESRLLTAVEEVEKTLGIQVENYTVTESINFTHATGAKTDTPCYVMFIEVSRDTSLDKLGKIQFEECLQRSHESYSDHRRQGSIGPMTIVQVHPGTFTSLRHLLTNPSMQFKMPRVLRKPEALTLLWTSRLDDGQEANFLDPAILESTDL